ncbi:MAG: hypothetical protein RBQ99_05300 [Trichlorobacter sp.]|nr:hypothetical protein [Trichlorobacter sp.]
MIDRNLLVGLHGKTLFYPCCGKDLTLPIELFASAISDFCFADKRPPWARRIRDAIPSTVEKVTGNAYRDINSGNIFLFNYYWQDAREVLKELPQLGVFFHRGDGLATEKGVSSGIPWLGEEYLGQILSKLVPGGFVVTDGSNCPQDGPFQLKRYYDTKEEEYAGTVFDEVFEYKGYTFSCLGNAGRRYGPTLIWQVN